MRQHRFYNHIFRSLLCAALLFMMAFVSGCGLLTKTPIVKSAPDDRPAAIPPQASSDTVEIGQSGIPDLDSKYFLKQLSEEDQRICAQMYAGISSFKQEIRFSTPISEKKLKTLMWLLSYDCPELFQINGEYSYFVQENKPDLALSIQPTYIFTKEAYTDAKKKLQDIIDLLQEEAAGLSGGFEKQLLFYQSIITRCTYREDGVYDGTAYGALVLGYARCEGYSKALTLLLREAGIECLTLTGEAWSADDSQTRAPQKHAWNVACIDGAYYQMDVTWDDSDGMLPESSCYAYLNLTDEEIYQSRTLDTLYDALDLPVCNDNASNYYVKTGAYIPDGADIEEALHLALNEACEKGDTSVSIRLATDAQLQELTSHLEKWMTAWYRNNHFSGSYNCTTFSVSNVFYLLDLVYQG